MTDERRENLLKTENTNTNYQLNSLRIMRSTTKNQTNINMKTLEPEDWYPINQQAFAPWKSTINILKLNLVVLI